VPVTRPGSPDGELIVDLYGTEAGSYARTAVGVATLPLDLPVVISVEVEIEIATPNPTSL
jgi:hypothetical protein